jgi:hypothetical protein
MVCNRSHRITYHEAVFCEMQKHILHVTEHYKCEQNCGIGIESNDSCLFNSNKSKGLQSTTAIKYENTCNSRVTI